VNRYQTLLQIAESFEDDHAVSLSPDLPELFEGPDVLAGRSGRLIAVFVPKANEARSPERLRTRLILSRLALPDHAQCLLALDESFHEASPILDLERDFHAVVHVDDRAGLRRFRSKPVEHRKIPPATRRMVERRMAFLFALGLPQPARALAAPSDLLEEPVQLSSSEPTLSQFDWTLEPKQAWSGPILHESELPHVRAAHVQVRDGVLIAGANGHHLPVRERVRPYLTVALRTAFLVDNGVPYLNRPTAGLLILHDTGQSYADPLKPLRASAFAGWALLSNPSREEFAQRVRAASKWLAGSVSDGT